MYHDSRTRLRQYGPRTLKIVTSVIVDMTRGIVPVVGKIVNLAQPPDRHFGWIDPWTDIQTEI